jgi:NDP-sugar pyrophosphorylase family protein
VVSNIDIIKMYNYHKKEDALATLAVRDRETSRYLLFNMENKLVGWRNISNNDEIWCNNKVEKVNQFAFSGIHWINTSLINSIEIKKQSIVPLYLEQGKDNKIVAYEHNDDYWFDCGKVESLELAEKVLLQ